MPVATSTPESRARGDLRLGNQVSQKMELQVDQLFSNVSCFSSDLLDCKHRLSPRPHVVPKPHQGPSSSTRCAPVSWEKIREAWSLVSCEG